jgi:hypothetical protein
VKYDAAPLTATRRMLYRYAVSLPKRSTCACVTEHGAPRRDVAGVATAWGVVT